MLGEARAVAAAGERRGPPWVRRRRRRPGELRRGGEGALVLAAVLQGAEKQAGWPETVGTRWLT